MTPGVAERYDWRSEDKGEARRKALECPVFQAAIRLV